MATMRGFAEAVCKRLTAEREKVKDRLADGSFTEDPHKVRELQGRAKQLREAIDLVQDVLKEEEAK